MFYLRTRTTRHIIHICIMQACMVERQQPIVCERVFMFRVQLQKIDCIFGFHATNMGVFFVKSKFFLFSMTTSTTTSLHLFLHTSLTKSCLWACAVFLLHNVVACLFCQPRPPLHHKRQFHNRGSNRCIGCTSLHLYTRISVGSTEIAQSKVFVKFRRKRCTGYRTDTGSNS